MKHIPVAIIVVLITLPALPLQARYSGPAVGHYSRSTHQVCGDTWPRAYKPRSQDTRICAEYWLSLAYGCPDVGADLLAADPVAGEAIALEHTAQQLTRMASAIEAPCDGACGPRPRRVVQYLRAEARIRFDTTDPWRDEPIDPLLNKVLRGERLTAAELEGPTWSDATLWRLRNAAYACHGRAFRNPDLQKFFYEDRDLAVDPEYRDVDLTPADRWNALLVAGQEKYQSGP